MEQQSPNSAAQDWAELLERDRDEQFALAAESGDGTVALLIRKVSAAIRQARRLGLAKAYVLKLTDADIADGDIERLADDYLLSMGSNARFAPDLFTGKAAEVLTWLQAPEQGYDCWLVYPPHQPDGSRFGYLRVRPKAARPDAPVDT